MFSTIHYFLPESCNKNSTLERNSYQRLCSRKTCNGISNNLSIDYLQTLVNLQFLIFHSKKIIDVFIINFHIGNSNQKLPIGCLRRQAKNVYLNPYILTTVEIQFQLNQANGDNTISISVNISFTARWIIPGSFSEPFMVKVFPLLVCPYANAVPAYYIITK